MSKGIKHKDIGGELSRTEWEADDSHELEQGTSFPGSPTEKDRFYRTDEHQWYIYNGTDWKKLGGTDISDADAAVGDVKSPKTFYAGAEPKKTGTMPTVTLAPDSSAYPAGYHVGDGGGLPAVEADLVTGNIKATITIFDVLGHNNVRDISDANLVVAEAPTGKTFYAVSGARKTGTGTKTLSPANDTVEAGYYAATTLSVVDGDLDTANIKSGITIFGKAGSTDVRNVSDANALIAEVKSGRTFYAVGGAKKTGTMPTVALSPTSSAYPAGYHAGDGGGLPAIDADLVTGSIKSGITIFNVPGHTDVRNVSDADAVVGEVKSPKTFYAVGGAKKTGTMPTQTLSAASETVAAGYYAATTLSAVDADLTPGNILRGVTIFGITGVDFISADQGTDSIYIHRGVTSTVMTSFSIPGANRCTGLTYDGANLISCEDIASKIFIHSGVTSTVTTSFATPSANVMGLTYDGANLISISNKVFIHSGITSTITTSFNLPQTGTFIGLAYDGTNLLSTSNQYNTLYIHSGVTSTITTSFSYPVGISEGGIAYDGVNLISCDSGPDSIFVYSGITSTITTSFSTPGTAVLSITIY